MPSSPDPSASLGQILTFAGKLTEALASADDLGGLARLPMKPATSARLAERLKLLRAEIDEQLEGLERAESRKARRPLLRRQANRPEPRPAVKKP